MKKKKTELQVDQSARFIEAARQLGCDESPDAFEAAVKKVARHKPVVDPDGKQAKTRVGQSLPD